MKGFLDFAKTTIVEGLLFLVPAVLIALLVKNAVELAGKILAPIEKILPVENIAGVAVAHLLAVVLILAVCFLAGLAARTSPGSKLNAWLERAILRKLPGLTLIKRVTHEMANIEEIDILPTLTHTTLLTKEEIKWHTNSSIAPRRR